MAVNKEYTNREHFDFFQSRFSGLGADSLLKYRRTLSELDCFLTGHHRLLKDISDVMVADWATDLFRQGLAKSTVVRHLNILNSLVKDAVKNGMLEPNDAPRRLARHLEDSAFTLPPLIKESALESCLTVLRDSVKPSDKSNVYADMVLLSILNGTAPFQEVANLKKDGQHQYDEVSRTIIERNRAPKRGYVFDLRQSYNTPRQLYGTIGKEVETLFSHIIDIKPFDPDTFIRSLWAACAMKCGATASEALSMVDGDASYSIPSFCKALQTPSAEKSQWIRPVNALLTCRMPKWYAMHIRKGVQYEDLRKEIAQNLRPMPELFYPCEKIRKQTGGKTVVEEQPFILRTAFFKSSPESVMPMFRIIGDKAWCYRASNSPSAPYAVISPEEMRRFQTAVGIFTPDTEIHPLGELSPKPGESVIVMTAGYGNREGEVEEVINRDCGSVIFRVKLSTDQGYEWRMDVDSRQIERILNS